MCCGSCFGFSGVSSFTCFSTFLSSTAFSASRQTCSTISLPVYVGDVSLVTGADGTGDGDFTDGDDVTDGDAVTDGDDVTIGVVGIVGDVGDTGGGGAGCLRAGCAAGAGVDAGDAGGGGVNDGGGGAGPFSFFGAGGFLSAGGCSSSCGLLLGTGAGGAGGAGAAGGGEGVVRCAGLTGVVPATGSSDILTSGVSPERTDVESSSSIGI